MTIDLVRSNPFGATISQCHALKKDTLPFDSGLASDDQAEAMNDHNSRTKLSLVGDIQREKVLLETSE